MYLINHEKQCYASQDKAGVLYCKCCSIKFPSIHDLDNHYKLLADNQGSKNTLECLFCGIKLESDDSFMYHVKHHHLKKFELPETFQSKGDRASTQIPCRFCSLTFKNKNWVISHERKQHSSEVIKCDICLEDIKMENAKSHYVSHRLQERYKNTPDKVCNICGVKIKNLDSHMVRHEDHRKHKCELCTKSFKLHWDLKRHLLVHSNEARHICQVCGKGFKVGYNLRVHMRSHENIKPFPCLICQKTFTTKQWRDNHLKTHG
ncbi:hypothetical protein GWI33_008304 [Rhynchophorus ferrugineus]|uniref:C2H2-type domain-containing protein n=1 Tax=Rhynchophorus ferrugineus TaxID=354439 RepID=A0A834MK02_RHYFE|nr:hypothetical protein GWI33_008304 [Rhynchophorus ferrugineus]